MMYVCGILVMLFFFFGTNRRSTPPLPLPLSPSNSNLFKVEPTAAGHRVVLRPTIETLAGVEVVSQSNNALEVKGWIAVFHGCAHGAKDWFDLPEERQIVKASLAAGLGVVAFSSQQRTEPRCWSSNWPPEDNIDIVAVMRALPLFLEREKGTHLPLFAIGASSGGTFVSLFARVVKVQLAVIQISPGSQKALDLESGSRMRLERIPSLVFVYMTRDELSAIRIQQVAKYLKDNRVEVDLFECAPHPLTSIQLSDRIELLSEKLSQQLLERLKKAEYLTDDGSLREDPRQSDILSVSISELTHLDSKLNDKPDLLVQLRESLREEFNWAYAEHELTSEHFLIILNHMLAIVENSKQKGI